MIGTKQVINSPFWLCILLVCAVHLLLAGDGAAQHSEARGPLVADLMITGCREVPTEKLLPYVQTKPGREYSPKLAYDDLARLAQSHLCKPVGVRTEPTTDGRVNVIFEVQEYKRVIGDVIYQHNKHVSTKELEGITRVRAGMPMNRDQIQLACHEIESHLKQQGYYFANVKLVEGNEAYHDRVVFNIT